MRKFLRILGVIALIAIVGVWTWHSLFVTPLVAPITAKSAKGNSASITSISENTTAKSANAQAIETLLTVAGFHTAPPVKQRLRDAVSSGDDDNILRAFHDAIYEGYSMSDAIPSLQTFLDDPNPFVRFSAAQDLLIVGEHSGYDTLVSLAQSDSQFMALKQDVRIQAAQTLAKFREKDAVNTMINLYNKSPNADLDVDITRLGVQFPNAKNFPFYASTTAIVEYAESGATWQIPQIVQVFQGTTKPDLKLAAAWALATMTGDQDATNYLIQQAEDVVTHGETKNNGGVITLEYLGTIQSAETKHVLEVAVDNSYIRIADVALVNLIYNQGGSDKANKILLGCFTGSWPQNISADLAEKLAIKSTNPQIQAAAKAYAAKDPANYKALEIQKDWSIYNWIDNYVIKLDNPPPGP